MVCKSCGFEFDNGDNRTCPQCGAEVLLDNSEENSTIEHNKDNVVKPDKETENGVSKILRMISVAIAVIGFILGYAIGYNAYGHELLTMIIYWTISFIFSMSFLGFSEIILLLQKLVDKSDLKK